MSSCKRSCATHEKYGGTRGKEELREAIEFLFQIKGREFQKKFPDVSIPSVDMFFTYARKANEDLELVKKSSKRRAHKASRTLRSPPSPTKSSCSEDHSMDTFLAFLTPWLSGLATQKSLFTSLNIVLYAVLVYTFTNEFLELYAEHKDTISTHEIVSNICCDTSYDRCVYPFRWFLENIMPRLSVCRSRLLDIFDAFMQQRVRVVLPKRVDIVIPTTHISVAIGKAFAQGMQFLFLIPQTIDCYFIIPVSGCLGAAGFDRCKAIFRETLTKYVEVS